MFNSSKYKTLRDLHKRLLEEGIVGYTKINNFRQYWIYPREKSGSLVCPKDATRKRNRLFTKKQIDEIAKAFKPGGVGVWSYK